MERITFRKQWAFLHSGRALAGPRVFRNCGKVAARVEGVAPGRGRLVAGHGARAEAYGGRFAGSAGWYGSGAGERSGGALRAGAGAAGAVPTGA